MNNNSLRVARALLLLTIFLPLRQVAAQDGAPGTTPTAGAIHEILSASPSPVPEIDAALGSKALERLRTFYASRDDAPLWSSSAIPLPEAGWILDRPTEAVPKAVASLLTAAVGERVKTDSAALARRDLLLSAVYAAAAVMPSDPLATPDATQSLSLLAGAKDRQQLLADTLPLDPGFWRLREAILLYRGLAVVGGWPAVPEGPKLAPGDSGDRVEALRQRLIATGDLAASAKTGSFDLLLQQAVQHFQARHGLETDGIVGTKTLAALNVPVGQRLGVMAANLIRLQHQHRDWGQRYIAVNIAAASYRLFEGGRMVFERPAVVGRPGWPTPVLDSMIDRIELHPYWHIPMNIADQEVWPKQDADPSYFARKGIHVVNGGLVQNPGPANPLGSVKFVFDNPYSVYLHDTTAPELFAKAYRFSSHGCVRVSDAADLARELLAPDPQWSAESVAQALETGGHQTVPLLVPIAIHVVYDTAWAEEDGTVQFREDIYHRDVIPPARIDEEAPGPMAKATGDTAQQDCNG